MKKTRSSAGVWLVLLAQGAVLLLARAGIATAQTAPSSESTSSGAVNSAPAERPASSTQPITPAKPLPADQLLGQMLRPASTAGRPLAPAEAPAAIDATSGSGAVAPAAPAQTVLREGTFIVDRTARLSRTSDGQQMQLLFEADGRALKDPPMILVPNLKLMSMEDAVTNASRDLRFRVTGMVTEYRGRNYLLLEKVIVIPDATQQF